jgi:putative membrane protein
MKRTFRAVAGAAAVWALVTLPATAQSSGSGSAGSGGSQGSSSGSGATDQQGSTHGGQTGSSHAGTSGQAGTGQSGTAAGGDKAATTRTSAKGSSPDRSFIAEAAAGGMAEVELGRLASQKASSSDVKEFGQMMVDDHTKANDQLKKIATGKGVTAPHALKPQDKATQERLSKLSGEAFDRAYMQHMVKDHQKDVALFRKQSTSASDPEVKQFASSTLPTLERHLQRAQALAKTVGGAGDTARGTSGSSSAAGAGGKKGAAGSKRTGHASTSGASGSGTTGGAARPPR